MNVCSPSWRWKAAVVFSLSLALHCRRETALPPARTTEPRLTGFDTWHRCTKSVPPGHVVELARCAPANPPRDLVSLAVSDCEDSMTTAADAVRLLAYVPLCTSAAVDHLEKLAKTKPSPSVLSDLSAGYFLRAQRGDRPSDFVRSLDAADRACALAPTAQARFNRALAQEALGFSSEAARSWDELRKDGTPWAREAAEHQARLAATINRSKAAQWALNQELLPRAAAAGDHKAVDQLVAPYLNAAQLYVETKVLPDWATASAAKSETAATHLRLAEMIATALAARTNDRYLLDAVQKIPDCPDAGALKRLSDAYGAFGAMRTTAMKPGPWPEYASVERALKESGSSLQFGLMLGMATGLTQERHYDQALALLRSTEREAVEHHYPYLLARVHTGRGYVYLTQGRHIEALAEYSQATSVFERTHDLENFGKIRSYLVGLFRQIGDPELTWRASFQNQRYANDLVDAQSRHLSLGENATSAVELGYPAVGLQYQNLAVRLLQDELSRDPGEGKLQTLRDNLGIALFRRAWIQVHLGRSDAALADLNASTALVKPSERKETGIPAGYRARIAEISAQRVAGKDRPRAISKLSEAIGLASTTYYQTLSASLRIQRAELYLLDGNRSAAAADLRAAVASLQAEEKAALDRPPDQLTFSAEQLWSAYFARAQETYRRLIHYYVEEGSDAEAFRHAERARAYEPLHLILRRPDLPPAFRNLIHDGEPLRLDAVERIVPSGTFLLQYSVDDERTYVWVIGEGRSERLELPVGESTIRGWTHTLHRYADLRDEKRFTAALAEPYAALLEKPLALVAKLQGREQAKVVIVPDRSMHGLPFAALRNGRGYLMQEHPVSVAGSSTLYVFSLLQDRQLSAWKKQSVLLFADPAIDQKLDVARDQPSLLAARSEAERIRSVYAPVAQVDPPHMGEQATVPELLRLSAESTIVHIAAHGIANAEVPSRSYLLLAPTENDTGVIDAERLLKELRLTRTRLVVLSACSSAGGTPVGPEGLAPLVRPLIAAGVPGIVGTLWDVSDSLATEDLLVRFHHYYRDGEDADNALRLAQMDMLGHSSKGHQAVWAWSAYQMNGFASSPFPASAGPTRR
ncbi:MAG: CHAT domain-containing protein [Acidobacteriota bacterium]